MNLDNKTVLIIGITALGIAGAVIGYNECLLAVASGLIGYLSKDGLSRTSSGVEYDEEGA